jgi:cytoskeletal protein CcmA (bactofilin family)
MTMFAKKGDRKRELVEMLDDDNVVGFLEPGVEVEGKLKVSAGMLILNSHLKGELACEGMLVVGAQGEVEGEVHTKQISITGKVKGTIHASESLEIKKAGVVLGDIYTPKLFVEPGGYFDGQCHMPTPEPEKHPEPSKQL